MEPLARAQGIISAVDKREVVISVFNGRTEIRPCDVPMSKSAKTRVEYIVEFKENSQEAINLHFPDNTVTKDGSVIRRVRLDRFNQRVLLEVSDQASLGDKPYDVMRGNSRELCDGSSGEINLTSSVRSPRIIIQA